MISSTFADLQKHREVLIKTIKSNGLTDEAMENDGAKTIDVIESSLQMVRNCYAYTAVIAERYGQIPPCPKRNPDNLSITELEFNEAVRLKRPILLFLSGSEHPWKKADFEKDPGKQKKLEAFRERAKEMGPDSKVHRIYATFDSLEHFKEKVAISIPELRRSLDQEDEERASHGSTTTPKQGDGEQREGDLIPKPPAFYAEPRYLGSHNFVGRRDQLDNLNEWAVEADPHPVLLFEAIGGSGKSMLTWEWVQNHAPNIRTDWAGRFWYSFYERGAIMVDFCQCALAYMTGQPLKELKKKKAAELIEPLLHQLESKPWLLVLDGLERVLVAYNRLDAAYLRDEEAGQTDVIAKRDVCASIRPQDDELLRALAAATPSKLLITSRLTPRVFLNRASQPIPGVRRIPLPGLRATDAEELFRACGITGDSSAIQNFLRSHCDCHPLTIGVLAGLVNDYRPKRGNFDRWAADPAGGGKLNLAELNLVQKRNHILLSAIEALSPDSNKLLSLVALLSEAVDYQILAALNPFLPPEIKAVPDPNREPKNLPAWAKPDPEEKRKLKENFTAALLRWEEYQSAVQARLKSPEFRQAEQKLDSTLKDLEQRGLLQYDKQAEHYDLHPVVRGVASGKIAQSEKEIYSQRVVDYFSSIPHNPYEQAETLEDVRDGLRIVRTLLLANRYSQAAQALRGDLARALLFNLEAAAELASLLRPFFPDGWPARPIELLEMGPNIAVSLATDASIALAYLGQTNEAISLFETCVAIDLENNRKSSFAISFGNLSSALRDLNQLAKEGEILSMAVEFAELGGNSGDIFACESKRFQWLTLLGRWQEADALWTKLEGMGRDWPRNLYRPGEAEGYYAGACHTRGCLKEELLTRAIQRATSGRNRATIRMIHGLRGEWLIDQGKWKAAIESLEKAVQMAREVNLRDTTSETLLALARFRLGLLSDPRHEAEQLGESKERASFSLAKLWLAIGEPGEAQKYALESYRWAWAAGEPYVRRFYLDRSRVLLEELGAEIPRLPPYDPAKDRKFPWENAARAALEQLRAEKKNKDQEIAERP